MLGHILVSTLFCYLSLKHTLLNHPQFFSEAIWLEKGPEDFFWVDNPFELPKKPHLQFSFSMLHHTLLLSLSASFYHNLSHMPTPTSAAVLSLPASPSAHREQTVALISLGLIPSHFLKDFNYCLLY